jgi:simple sugar transport system ATP-binding protein
MMGEDTAVPPAAIPRGQNPGVPVVELQNVTLKSAETIVLDEISLALTARSIIGIAGVDGNGQDELVQVMAGVRAPTSGSIVVRKPGTDARDALAVIPQDRDVDGLILDLSLWENLLLSRGLRHRSGSRRGWIRRSQAIHVCEALMRRFSIRASGPNALAGSLSGGNRQRLAVARALETIPAAIVAHDICRGLDLNAAAELRARLLDYAARGGAVLLISTDLDELLALCDRLYVINGGRITQVRAERRDAVEIGLLMSGAAQTSARSNSGADEPKPHRAESARCAPSNEKWRH